MSVGKSYKIQCEAIGSKPMASITWWMNNKQVSQSIQNFCQPCNTNFNNTIQNTNGKLIVCMSDSQIHTFVAKSVYSIGSNLTISTLTFAPKPKDNGRVLGCQAKITDLPGSGMDDKKKIAVYCKYIFLIYFLKYYFFSRLHEELQFKLTFKHVSSSIYNL